MNSKNLRHPRTISTVVEDEIYQAFADALPKHMTVAEAIREHMASVVEEVKKAEDLETALPILGQTIKGSKQTKITEYDIKLFQQPQERMQNLKHLTKNNLQKVAIDVVFLQQQIRAAR